MNKLNPGSAMALGIGISTALGVAFDNISMGVALDAAFGAVFGAMLSAKNKNSDDK